MLNHYDLILAYFPLAKFIHIIRDPRDRALSHYNTWGKSMILSAYKYNKSFMATSRIIGISNQNYIEVFYEDLITTPQVQMKKIGDFINLEFNSSHLLLKKPLEKYGSVRNTVEIQKDNHSKFHTIDRKLLFKIEGILLPSLQLIKRYKPSNSVILIELTKLHVYRLYIYDFYKTLKFHLSNKNYSSFRRTFVNVYNILKNKY
jgi:hypothetical protein